jgi:perosamine synthetase
MLTVPFARTHLDDAEIFAVVEVLQSGWLTSGPNVRKFEAAFAAWVVGNHAVCVSSATAALHLGVEAQGLRAGQAVLVPTLTFAATAEVVRYQGAVPILVDSEPETLNVDYEDAAQKVAAHREGRLLDTISPDSDVVGVIPVHVGGLVVDVAATRLFAQRHELWIVEDAAHAFPAAWRRHGDAPWVRVRRRHCRCDLLLFLCEQDHYHGRGGNGGHSGR